MKKGHAAVVVHDVVNVFLSDTDRALVEALPNIYALVEAARRAGVPVVFIAPGQGKGDPTIGPDPRSPSVHWGTEGVEIPSDLGPMPGDTVIRKPRWGGFYGSNLADHLRSTGRDTVIVCGISLAGGVDTTIRDAYNRDFHSILVADASRCRAIDDHGWGAFTAEEIALVEYSTLSRFGDVMWTADLIRELTNWV